MATTQDIAIGSRWRLRQGQHAGSVVQITGNNGRTVRYRNLGGGKSVGSTPYDDSARLHTRDQGEFLSLFEPATSGGNGQTHSAWRRVYKPPEKEPEESMPRTSARVGEHSNGHHIHTGESGLSISVETITPDMAQTWLDRGGNNRRPSERGILKLVYAIQMGEWDLTGETIKLDKDGRVRDGQHRLHAIIRAGIPVQCIVVRGIPESAFDKIDTGKARTPANVLEIHGHAQSVAKASTARGLMYIEQFGRYAPGTARSTAPPPSNAAVLAYVEAHPEIEPAIHMADRLRVGAKFVGGTGLWAIAFALFIRVSPDQAEVFCQSLIEGANLESGSPVLKLRNQYIGGGRDWQATGEQRERLLALAIKAWNFWRHDELVSVLTWHNSGRSAEKFPVAE